MDQLPTELLVKIFNDLDKDSLICFRSFTNDDFLIDAVDTILFKNIYIIDNIPSYHTNEYIAGLFPNFQLIMDNYSDKLTIFIKDIYKLTHFKKYIKRIYLNNEFDSLNTFQNSQKLSCFLNEFDNMLLIENYNLNIDLSINKLKILRSLSTNLNNLKLIKTFNNQIESLKINDDHLNSLIFFKNLHFQRLNFLQITNPFLSQVDFSYLKMSNLVQLNINYINNFENFKILNFEPENFQNLKEISLLLSDNQIINISINLLIELFANNDSVDLIDIINHQRSYFKTNSLISLPPPVQVI